MSLLILWKFTGMTNLDKKEITRIARESGLEEAIIYVKNLFGLSYSHAAFIAKTAKEAPVMGGPFAVC